MEKRVENRSLSHTGYTPNHPPAWDRFEQGCLSAPAPFGKISNIPNKAVFPLSNLQQAVKGPLHRPMHAASCQIARPPPPAVRTQDLNTIERRRSGYKHTERGGGKGGRERREEKQAGSN